MAIKLVQDNETNSIILVWPDMDNLIKYGNKLKEFYINLMRSLLLYNINVVLINNNKNDIINLRNIFSEKFTKNLKIIKYKCDDIWIRDYGPLIARNVDQTKKIYINYKINGYGGKYNYKNNSNFFNYFKKFLHNNESLSLMINDIFFEGGNIIYNNDIIIINKWPLRQHNGEQKHFDNFKKFFIGMDYKILTIDIKGISGDDTSGHIDNLVRIHDNVILYMSTEDKNHPDYDLLKDLDKQLTNNVKTLSGYDLIPINHSFNDVVRNNGKILPFSYLNYVQCGQSIFIPKIKKVSQKVRWILKSIFKNHQIVFIDIGTLLQELGGLHCCSLNIVSDE